MITEHDVLKELDERIMAKPDALDLLKRYLIDTGHDATAVKGYRSIGAARVYDTEIDVTDFSYNNLQAAYTPQVVGKETYVNNDEKAELNSTFVFSKVITDTFGYKFNEGLKIGTTAKGKAGLPLVAEGEISVSGEISFSAEQAWTATETTNWSHSKQVRVPPRTSVVVTATLSVAQLTATFTAKAVVNDGKIFVSVQVPAGDYTDVFVPLSALLPSRDERSISLAGTFSGTEGVSIVVSVDPIK